MSLISYIHINLDNEIDHDCYLPDGGIIKFAKNTFINRNLLIKQLTIWQNILFFSNLYSIEPNIIFKLGDLRRRYKPFLHFYPNSIPNNTLLAISIVIGAALKKQDYLLLKNFPMPFLGSEDFQYIRDINLVDEYFILGSRYPNKKLMCDNYYYFNENNALSRAKNLHDLKSFSDVSNYS